MQMQPLLTAGHPALRGKWASTRSSTRPAMRIASFLAAALLTLAMLPMPEAHAAGTDSLKLGMSGTAVKTLQTNLVKRGYLKAADGKFGKATQTAVKLFQKHAGVAQDGVAGPGTQSILYGLTGSGKTNQTLKPTNRGAEVKILQQRLISLGYLRNSKADGSFGAATKAALIKFQKKVGLSADGVAGPRTLIKLYSSSAPKYMTKGEQVVAFAKTLLGIKYVYGAESPDKGFDCSGLVWYVYKHFGVTVERSSGALIHSGTAVAGGLSKAKPGDILCFGDSLSTVGHVAIYVGNNQYIHAPQTGDVVKIETLNTHRINTCQAVRRVFTSDD